MTAIADPARRPGPRRAGPDDRPTTRHRPRPTPSSPTPPGSPSARTSGSTPRSKRLVLRARVALQDGALEHLLCRKGTKEHESILATEAPAKLIHAGLLLTGATPGHPVRFEPKFEPPAGSADRHRARVGAGRQDSARPTPASGSRTRPPASALARDWVFAGSELFEDPRTKTMIYAADDGDLITVANFPASILDLPFRSSANDADRGYVANPDRVPPEGRPSPCTSRLRRRPEPSRTEARGRRRPARCTPSSSDWHAIVAV